MYALGTQVLKDILIDSCNQKNDNLFDEYNLIEELNGKNIEELNKIHNIHDNHKLFKTLESSNIIYETEISLIEELKEIITEYNNPFKDLEDDWDFKF